MKRELKLLLGELNTAWDKEPELLMKLGFTEKTMVICEDALKDTIAISWHIDDIKELDSTLSDDEAREILEMAEDMHDATVGINWDVLQEVINIYKTREEMKEWLV